MSADLDPKLVKLAFEAVRSADAWQKVLQHLIQHTPAKAAIITLRDRHTCQIVNDDALEQEYFSPLVQGFSMEAVQFYLLELRTIDPWAAAQINHYPHRPTLMSSICHPNSVPDQRFFDWLATCGLRDTITFELDRVPGNWTAINLFLEDIGGADSFRLLEYCDAHQTILREAWQSSQHVVQCQQSGLATLEQFERWGIPACICTANGELFLSNAAFEGLCGNGIAKVSGPKRKLSLARDCAFNANAASLPSAFSRHDDCNQKVIVSISNIDPDPLYSNKKDSHWLIRFQLDEQPITHAPVNHTLDSLTGQEKRLFKAVSQGANVVDAGHEIGIKRSRTFDVWANIKTKLGINNAHQLRGLIAAQSAAGAELTANHQVDANG